METNILLGGTIISVLIAFWQFFENRSQKEKLKAQVKVWMQDANGISLGLKRIVRDNINKKYSSTDDVCNAVWAVESSASALYQSLYEERCVTEEEYKARQKKFADFVEKRTIEKQENPALNPPKG
jgi:uncharacterized protein YoxC